MTDAGGDGWTAAFGQRRKHGFAALEAELRGAAGRAGRAPRSHATHRASARCRARIARDLPPVGRAAPLRDAARTRAFRPPRRSPTASPDCPPRAAPLVADRRRGRVMGRPIRDAPGGSIRDPARRRHTGRLGGPARAALARSASRRRRRSDRLRRPRGIAVPAEGRAAVWQRAARTLSRDDRRRGVGGGAAAAHHPVGGRAGRGGPRRARDRRTGDPGRQRVPVRGRHRGSALRPFITADQSGRPDVLLAYGAVVLLGGIRGSRDPDWRGRRSCWSRAQ